MGITGILKLVTRINHRAIANSHTPKFNMVNTNTSQSAVSSPVFAWGPSAVDCSASVFTFWRAVDYLKAPHSRNSWPLTPSRVWPPLATTCYGRLVLTKDCLRTVLVSITHLGPKTAFLSPPESYGSVVVGCPLWREDGSVVYCCCWPSPAQSF
jgi:hypothetical protein